MMLLKNASAIIIYFSFTKEKARPTTALKMAFYYLNAHVTLLDDIIIIITFQIK